MFYLKDPKAHHSLIYLITTEKGIRFKYSTGESISTKLWEDGKVKDPKHPVNATLNRYRLFYHSLIDNCKLNNTKITRIFLKTQFENEFKINPKTTGTDFYKMINRFINDSESGNRTTRKGTHIVPLRIKQYSAFKNKLLGFKESVNVNEIDINFYKDYVSHRNSIDNGKDKDGKAKPKGKSLNSIGSELSILKAILKYTFKLGLHTNRFWEHEDFRTFDEEVENVFLSDMELDILWGLELSKKLTLVRDLFIIGCYTGLRIADLSSLDKSNIEGNLIKVITGKTGEIVYIPIHWRVQELMKKYNGFPSAYSDQRMNEYIKDICKIAEFTSESIYKKTVGGKKIKYKQVKWEKVTNHTARRSFATNMYLAGFDTISIMKITGHRTEKSFMKYICVSQRQMADRMREHPYFKK